MKKRIEILYETFKKQGAISTLRLFFEWAALKLKPSYSPLLPSMLQIEPTINCNLRCEMCDRSLWNRHCKDMNLSQFQDIIKQFKFIRTLNLQGMGEPLLNKDFIKMIDFAKENNILCVKTVTNATLLDKSKCKELLESKIDSIGMSLDSVNPKTYENIRKGAKFETTISNIRLLTLLNKNKKIHIGMTCDLKTIDEAEAMLELVYEMGIKSFTIQGIHTWGKEEWQQKKGNLRLSRNLSHVKSIMNKLEKRSKVLSVEFQYSLFVKKYKICTWPWMGTYITADGFVTPCGIHGTDPRKFNFGNVFKKPFKDIWNCKEYRKFRNELKRGKVPDFCKGCSEI